MVLTTYGRSSGFCIDPIEKKPLNHFLPGTSVLSFGTAGCNLGCKFCQNWDISKSREMDRLARRGDAASASPRPRAQLGCRSVAFTYNDPVIWAEYAIDTADACHALGVKTVAVTAGYITAEPRREFFDAMDAANVDLKAFTEDFYQQLRPVAPRSRCSTRCAGSSTRPHVWLEITNLLIPGPTTTHDEIDAMCDWIAEHLGADVPLHFTAFHPDFKMIDIPPTPPATLRRARQIAHGQRAALRLHRQRARPRGRHHLLPRLRRSGDRARLVRGSCATHSTTRPLPACGTRVAGRFAQRFERGFGAGASRCGLDQVAAARCSTFAMRPRYLARVFPSPCPTAGPATCRSAAAHQRSVVVHHHLGAAQSARAPCAQRSLPLRHQRLDAHLGLRAGVGALDLHRLEHLLHGPLSAPPALSAALPTVLKNTSSIFSKKLASAPFICLLFISTPWLTNC